ncbi:MAG TPA: histone deacetylase [Pseudonocardiaceae bacterium]|nr:histone deacetylase [Pseudonocardiaceae bacterium]
MNHTDELVWYVSYGSNMHADRLTTYLSGGTPPGGHRANPGARDPRPPRRDTAVWLPGQVYFTTHSPVWNGGRAFYDPTLPGRAAARGWLITSEQFSDISAQEMYRQPGVDLDLTTVLATGRDQVGGGRYETLLHPGHLDGYPLLTFTAPWRASDLPGTAPSLAYLRMLAGGLIAAHGWNTAQAATYLAGLSGASGVWHPDDLAERLTDGPAPEADVQR